MDSSQLPNIPDNMSQQFSSALKRAQEIAQKLRSNAPTSKLASSLDSSTLAKVQQIASSISNKHNISGPSGNVDENEEVNDTMLIPASVAGLVIGKGGDTIRMLQERAQCRMFMVQDGIYANGPDKLLTFGGSRIRVEEAKKLVRDFLDDKDGLLKGIPNLSPGWVRNELTVPRESVGLIIGRGGDTIKKINMDTNCRVYFRVLDNNTPGDRVCIFEGMPEDIENAVMRVREIVALALRKNGIRIQQILLPDGYSIEEIPIKSLTANQIITRNNEYIKSVIAATGANIELNKGIDSTVSRNFIVFGLPNQIKHVREMFEDRVGAENVLPSVQPTNCQIQRIPNPSNVPASGFSMSNMGGYPSEPVNQAPPCNMIPVSGSYDPSAALYAAMNQQGIYADSGIMNPDPNSAAAMNPYSNQTMQNTDSTVNDAWNAYYSQLNQQQLAGNPAVAATTTDQTSAAWNSYYSQMSQQGQANLNQHGTADQTAWNSSFQNSTTEVATTATAAPENAQITIEQATAWADYYDQIYQQNLAQSGDQTTIEQALAWAKYYRDMIAMLGNSQDNQPFNATLLQNYETTASFDSNHFVGENKNAAMNPTTEPSLDINKQHDFLTTDEARTALPLESDNVHREKNLDDLKKTELVSTSIADYHMEKNHIEERGAKTPDIDNLSTTDQVETEHVVGHNNTLGTADQVEFDLKNDTDITSQPVQPDIDPSSDTNEGVQPVPSPKAKKATPKTQRKRKAKNNTASNDENELENTDLKYDENESSNSKAEAIATAVTCTTPGKGRGRRGRPPKNQK